MLQRLKDDRAGNITLNPTQRHAAMVLLRKVMTAAQIRAELGKRAEGEAKAEAVASEGL